MTTIPLYTIYGIKYHVCGKCLHFQTLSKSRQNETPKDFHRTAIEFFLPPIRFYSNTTPSNAFQEKEKPCIELRSFIVKMRNKQNSYRAESNSSAFAIAAAVGSPAESRRAISKIRFSLSRSSMPLSVTPFFSCL